MNTALFGFLTMAITLILYFLPSIIAFGRKKKNIGAIVIINFFFGWTVIGWILCLAWSLMQD